MELIPADANITVTYHIVPHLSHRKLIYEFPNPFRTANWGIGDKNGGDPADIDYLVIDPKLTGADKELYEGLISEDGPFQIIFSADDIQVAQRRRSN